MEDEQYYLKLLTMLMNSIIFTEYSCYKTFLNNIPDLYISRHFQTSRNFWNNLLLEEQNKRQKFELEKQLIKAKALACLMSKYMINISIYTIRVSIKYA